MQDALSVTQSQTKMHLSRIVIGVTAFLTVVDLFATQALLPTLTASSRSPKPSGPSSASGRACADATFRALSCRAAQI